MRIPGPDAGLACRSVRVRLIEIHDEFCGRGSGSQRKQPACKSAARSSDCLPESGARKQEQRRLLITSDWMTEVLISNEGMQTEFEKRDRGRESSRKSAVINTRAHTIYTFRS